MANSGVLVRESINLKEQMRLRVHPKAPKSILRKGDVKRLETKSQSQEVADNVICINVESDDSVLIGEEYGKEIGKKIICKNLKRDSDNVIVFPDSIEDVTISFIEGIVSALAKEIDRKDFYKYFTVTGNEHVVDKFREIIMMNV